MKWRVVILDDEQPAIDELTELLLETEQVESIYAFNDAALAIDQMGKLQPDVLFLDIEMPHINGLDVALQLRGRAHPCEVVFVTAYEKYSLEAFEVAAMDYLLKPVERLRLRKSLVRLAEIRRDDSDRVPSIQLIQCFGDLRVVGPLGSVRWKTAKAEELFCYFLTFRSVEIQQILEDVFRDSDTERGSWYLHTSLYQIRKALRAAGLEEHIQIKYVNRVYVTIIQGVTIDLEQFAEEQDPEKQVALYRGRVFRNIDAHWTRFLDDPYFLNYQKAISASIELAKQRKDYESMEWYQLKLNEGGFYEKL